MTDARAYMPHEYTPQELEDIIQEAFYNTAAISTEIMRVAEWGESLNRSLGISDLQYARAVAFLEKYLKVFIEEELPKPPKDTKEWLGTHLARALNAREVINERV